jgi:hypothetical protein
MAPKSVDPFGGNRNQFHLDFFAVAAVQVQKRWLGGFAHETEDVDAEVVEHPCSASHGRDVKTMPAWRDAGKYEPVGSGKHGACQKSGADGQGVMLEGQMNPEIHGAEKFADAVALHAVKSGSGIQHQHFEFMFLILHIHRQSGNSLSMASAIAS